MGKEETMKKCKKICSVILSAALVVGVLTPFLVHATAGGTESSDRITLSRTKVKKTTDIAADAELYSYMLIHNDDKSFSTEKPGDMIISDGVIEYTGGSGTRKYGGYIWADLTAYEQAHPGVTVTGFSYDVAFTGSNVYRDEDTMPLVLKDTESNVWYGITQTAQASGQCTANIVASKNDLTITKWHDWNCFGTRTCTGKDIGRNDPQKRHITVTFGTDENGNATASLAATTYALEKNADVGTWEANVERKETLAAEADLAYITSKDSVYYKAKQTTPSGLGKVMGFYEKSAGGHPGFKYENITLHTVQEIDYTKDITAYVTEHPIVVDIKAGNSLARYTIGEARSAIEDFRALDETLQELIAENGYYDEDKLTEKAVSEKPQLTQAELGAQKIAVKEDVLATEALYSYMLIHNDDRSFCTEKPAYMNLSDGVIEYTAGNGVRKYTGYVWADLDAYEAAHSGVTVTGFSYDVITTQSSQYRDDGTLPLVLKDTKSSLYYGITQSVSSGQCTARIVEGNNNLTITNYNEWNCFGTRTYTGTDIGRNDPQKRHVTVTFGEDAGENATVALTAVTYALNEDSSSGTVTWKEDTARKETLAAKVDLAYITSKDSVYYKAKQTTPSGLGKVMGFYEKSIYGHAGFKYENITIHTEKEVDCAADIIKYVNDNPIVIDLKEGYYDASEQYTAADAQKAMSGYRALTDDTVKQLLTDLGYYDEDALYAAFLPVPQVTGATMRYTVKEIDQQNLRFDYAFHDKVTEVPEGYTLLEFGVLFVTADRLRESTDLITKDYEGNSGSATGVCPLKHVVGTSLEGLAESNYRFHIEVKGTAIGSAEDTMGQYAQSRIISRAYARYKDADQKEIWLYSTKDNIGSDGTTLVVKDGQINRSLMDCAKNILRFYAENDEDENENRIDHYNDALGETGKNVQDILEASALTESDRAAVVSYLSENNTRIRKVLNALNESR